MINILFFMKNKEYQIEKIEKKYQRIWEKEKVFEPDLKKAKKPFFNLMMFPYPSAEGLHVGNMYAFTGSDIYGRFKRMQGFDVFEPIGLDGFGIHSENYALKIGKHPMILSKITQKRFYSQLRAIGNAFAWSYKIETYNPNYYRWTQWLFLQLFKAGLAYRKEAPVNFCPSCKTVLADEQVIQGKCERCDSQVEVKFLKQWFFKITKYAERILNNLEKLDWSEKVKIAQKNWIGKSEGAKVKFQVVDNLAENSSLFIEVFTTRIDTIFGVTYLVISPFHELIRKGVLKIFREARDYIETVSKKIKEESNQEKSGVFSGLYAINPATQEKIPIWISNYVLASYGTGAIMGVPAHDQRDFEFAQKYDLPIKEVIQNSELKSQNSNSKVKIEKAYEGEGILKNSAQFNNLTSKEAREKILKWLAEKNLAEKSVSYHLRDWLISRQRYWGPPLPIIYCHHCFEALKKKDSSNLREGVDYEIFEGEKYRIVPVPEKDLPVRLPYIENFKPLGSGKSPLAQESKFYKTKCPVCHKEAFRETDVSDTFLDSAWYFLRYPSARLKNVPFDKKINHKWLPVDMYIGGAEHSVLHLLYSRFICFVLKDLGFIHFEEPFKKFRAHGLLISQGAKMSKSRGNVINPDEYIKKYGADTLRMYLMFLGPFDQGGDFRDEGIMGISRFLKRAWKLISEAAANKKIGNKETKPELERIKNRTIKKVTEDIENLKFNTAIASLMEYLKALEKYQVFGKKYLEVFVLLLAPFAPHFCEALWQNFFAKKSKKFQSVFSQKWPSYDSHLVEKDSFTLIIQVNGRVRDRIEVGKGLSQSEAQKIAFNSPKIQKWLQNKKIIKTFYIQNKIINFLTN